MKLCSNRTDVRVFAGLVFFCLALGLTARAAPGELPALYTNYPEVAELYAAMQDTVTNATAPAPTGQLTLRFVPAALAEQRAHVRREENKVSKRFLSLQHLGYDAAAARLACVLSILEIGRPEDKKQSWFGLTVMGGVTAAQAEEIACAEQEQSLKLVFKAQLVSLKTEAQQEGKIRRQYLKWRDARIAFRRGDRELAAADAVVSNLAALPAGFEPLEPKKEMTRATVLDLEAEDLNGLIYFSDWEREQKGWYGKELNFAGGGGIAAVHLKNVGAVARHRFPAPLPPGTYLVYLDPFANTAFWGETAVEVRLGNAGGIIAWVRAEKLADQYSCEPLCVTQPVQELQLKALQCQGGGANAAPVMEEPVILLDKLRVERIEWREAEGQAAK